MHSVIRRILRFDFWGKKERTETPEEVLMKLEKEGKIEIYETYEDGKWDFCIKPKKVEPF
jgi:hypothetical protein